uniref:Uncharacterized protein n=1 Tax=Myotis myotis TaxID=51298 RepID=A0A7J7S1R9_MYOMY|nr:hypothetical protein mMyoMyo1_010047 [Myotis myotis]
MSVLQVPGLSLPSVNTLTLSKTPRALLLSWWFWALEGGAWSEGLWRCGEPSALSPWSCVSGKPWKVDFALGLAAPKGNLPPCTPAALFSARIGGRHPSLSEGHPFPSHDRPAGFHPRPAASGDLCNLRGSRPPSGPRPSLLINRVLTRELVRREHKTSTHLMPRVSIAHHLTDSFPSPGRRPWPCLKDVGTQVCVFPEPSAQPDDL